MEGPINVIPLRDRESRLPRRINGRSALVKQLMSELGVLRAEVERLRRENIELTEKVRTDALTGVASRAAWEEALRTEELHRQRSGAPVSVVMVDVDALKLVNDEVGHPAGDDLLRRCAGLLAGVTRATDLVARLGGDEFGVLLRYSDAEQARTWCARLQERRRELDDPQLRLSVGFASAPPEMSLAEAVHEADRQMYKMKMLSQRSGRQRAS